jgi:hypothetical protein
MPGVVEMKTQFHSVWMAPGCHHDPTQSKRANLCDRSIFRCLQHLHLKQELTAARGQNALDISLKRSPGDASGTNDYR